MIFKKTGVPDLSIDNIPVGTATRTGKKIVIPKNQGLIKDFFQKK